MNWLTAQVLQYIAGGLLLACIGLGAKGCALKGERDLALANQGKAEATRDAAITERDSWKAKTADARAANRAYEVAFAQLQEQSLERDRQVELQAQQAEKAIAASRAKAAAADRELGEFRRLFGNRPANCRAALDSLDRVCPAWKY